MAPQLWKGSLSWWPHSGHQECTHVTFGFAAQGLCVDECINNLSVPQLPPLP